MFVKIVQYVSPSGEDCSAPPMPLKHGFKKDKAYEVHAWVMEGSELRAVLVNDKNEVWGISNRHLRRTDPLAYTPILSK